ncbi:MAG: large subunit ribosomal protein [Candidatus Hydrogenedentes bacterium]|nr:large subunit ribosomal protein [Candidatus Hydrogenedentota bacterium]
MDLATLKNAPGSRKDRKRVGRGPGSTLGKTCGRGHKGQKSRSGYSQSPGFEGGQMPMHRRLPKRGFKHAKRYAFGAINLDALDRVFEDGATVTAESIVHQGLVEETRGGVKILGRGELTKRFNVTVHAVSPGARQKIEAAGGTVTLIGAAKTSSGASAERVEES